MVMIRLMCMTTAALLAIAAPTLAGEKPAEDKSKTLRLDKMGPVVPGAEAPWLAGWKTDGKPTNIALQLKGRKALAVVFFATWCKPCRKGLKLLADNRARLDESGIGVLLVDLMEEREAVAAYMSRMKLAHWPVIIDSTGQIFKDYGIVATAAAKDGAGSASLPRTVVVDSSRKVLALFGEEGSDYVDAILAAAEVK